MRALNAPIDTDDFDDLQLVSVNTAAQLLDLSPKSVYLLVYERTLPALKQGKNIKIRLTEIRKYLKTLPAA